MSSAPRISAVGLANRLGGDTPAPTEEQQAIIEAPLQPMLVVAGAGSGKTSTMADRVVWLIACGLVRPEHLLGLTFTRKAAAELSERIRSKLARLAESIPQVQNLSGEPTVSTYNAYAASLVTEHGIRIGVEPGTQVVTDTGRWQLARDLVCSWDGELTEFQTGIDAVTEKVLGLASGMAEHVQTRPQVAEFGEHLGEMLRDRSGPRSNDAFRGLQSVVRQHQQLLPLVDAWQERKRDRGVMDFADQLALAVQLVQSAPEVAVTERQRWQVVLLDEYQDTSHSQVTLLQHLFALGHPVCAVGDPNQSIYSWRGASAGTLQRFGSDFPTKSGERAAEVFLTRSWRNREEILAVANQLSEPLRQGSSVPQLEAGTAGRGYVATAFHESAHQEATWLAARFEELWSSESDTAAVLVRNRKQIAPLLQAFDDAGLPVEVVGSMGLLYYPEVAEAVATLRAAADPLSGPSLMRLLTGARWRLGPRDIQALWSRARELVADMSGFEPLALTDETEASLSDALHDLGEADQYSHSGFDRLQRIARELTWLRGRMDQSLPDVVRDAISISGLEVETLLHRGELTHLDTFVDVAAAFDSNAHSASVTSFLAYLEVSKERERGITVEGASVAHGVVQIMTVHAAKGLEWDVVAVPGLCGGVFPSSPRGTGWVSDSSVLPFALRGDASELPQLYLADTEKPSDVSNAVKAFASDYKDHRLEEERRLAYVAMTRARSTLLASGYCWEPEQGKPRKPADFLVEAHATATHPGPWLESTGGENPLNAEGVTAIWPTSAPLGRHQERYVAAAQAVAATDGSISDAERAQEWMQQAQLLLTERAQQREQVIELAFPSRMSVSQLQAAHADQQEYLRRLRRPMPQPPRAATGRGTSFHAWVEEFFQAEQMLPLAELAESEPFTDSEMERLQRNFKASEWATRPIAAVEVPFVLEVDSLPVRGRIDAVFKRDDGGFDVVDWKTGRVPSGAEAEAAAAQLALYRQAWAQLAEVDPAEVSVAFYYVSADRTIRPADLPSVEDLASALRTG